MLGDPCRACGTSNASFLQSAILFLARAIWLARSETCGNDYHKHVITLAGRLHLFDSFESAIQLLAPLWL
jgi:hypothetical protein